MDNVWRDKIELGRQQGFQEGFQESFQEGRRLERQDSARRMKQRGFSDKDIITVLSLTPEEAKTFLKTELPSEDAQLQKY